MVKGAAPCAWPVLREQTRLRAGMLVPGFWDCLGCPQGACWNGHRRGARELPRGNGRAAQGARGRRAVPEPCPAARQTLRGRDLLPWDLGTSPQPSPDPSGWESAAAFLGCWRKAEGEGVPECPGVTEENAPCPAGRGRRWAQLSRGRALPSPSPAVASGQLCWASRHPHLLTSPGLRLRCRHPKLLPGPEQSGRAAFSSLIPEFKPSKRNIGKNFNSLPLSFLFPLPFCCGMGVCGEVPACHEGWEALPAHAGSAALDFGAVLAGQLGESGTASTSP